MAPVTKIAKNKRTQSVSPKKTGTGREKLHSVDGIKEVKPGKDDLSRMLYFMLLHREAEERILALHKEGKIAGGVFSGRGMEAVCVGAASALDENDVLVPGYWDLGAHLVRGTTLRQVFCQFFGRLNGPTQGRDTNMHMGNRDAGIIGMSNHPGAMIPVAAGAALAGKINNKIFCTLALTGDTGVNSGDFHEALNAASTLNLPLVLVVENNHFSAINHNKRQYACKNLVERAAGYGIPGFLVDGNDVLDVYRATRNAVLSAKSGGGPVLIEAQVVREPVYPAKRDGNHEPLQKKAVDNWKKKDPVGNFTRYLESKKIVSAKIFKELSKKVSAEIDDAVQFAENSPFPELSEAGEPGIYAE
ncbi:thiamine pyrophosphate-dependent dehydrogenase E1 component subunit alpha [candidate division KSB1 bacterium]|nr:thiamine pyrophosphate-dependent dehydrogenase E1 component subunit alpha [candidate division KSB1 bacterium]